MRTSIIWSIIPILMLTASITVASAQHDQVSMLAVSQDDDNRGHGNDSDGHDEDNPGQGNGEDDGEGEEEDGNRGHGNDRDGHDEDNPGQGEGQEGGDEEDDQDDDASINVANTGNYTVEVTCEPDTSASQTECTFTGIAPESGKDIGHIDLTEEDICTEVVDGDYEYVDPDPNTGVTGYKSRGSEASFTLVLEGEVTVAGSTTYWFKVSDAVFPATGPGLRCGDMAAARTTQGTATPEPASTPRTNTGTLVVNTYQCADVPADTDSFDWFGECDPIGVEHAFSLTPVDTGSDEQRSEESGASGSAAFDSLAPGTYHLEIVDTEWCHAEADHVTAEGNVVIEADQPTTVWGFVCEDDTST